MQSNEQFGYNFGGGKLKLLENQDPSLKSTSVALATLGCKLNQAESESIGRQLIEAGCQLVEKDEKADIYLINTCSVTKIADRKSRQLLRAAHRRNPSSYIIALGCYAEGAGTAAAQIEGVNLVVKNCDKDNLVSSLRAKGLLPLKKRQDSPFHSRRTRSFIKVQEGCNLYCSYCIVPSLRGREKSVAIDNIISDIQRRIREGYQEIVLTGTELGHYSFQGLDLKGLISEILLSTSISRLRISSLQPQDVDTELLKLWKDSRLCRHFHLSLQSGSDSVLARMRRRYSSDEFVGVLRQIRDMIPGAAITTDVIVGFPGETDLEFRESYDLSRELNFSRIHVFPFSPRRGTKAADMPGQISNQLMDDRVHIMLSLASETRTRFLQGFVNTTFPVLFETGSQGLWWGLTDNYAKVYAECTRPIDNQIANITLSGLFKDGIRGEIARS